MIGAGGERMNCAEFERRLAELMGGDFEEGARHDRIVELRDHARHCSECEATLDLIELLGSPPGGRDFVEVPEDAYWSSFEDRLRARIRESPSRRMSMVALGSAAAAAVVLVLASWMGFGHDPGSSRPNGSEPIRFDLAHAVSSEIEPLEFPDELSDLLVRTAAEEVDDAVGFVGLESWPEASLVGLQDFDAEYDAVLAALPAAARAEALAPNSEFEAAWNEGLGVGSVSTLESVGLYPDLSDLDSVVRVKLLEWLNSQTGA